MQLPTTVLALLLACTTTLAAPSAPPNTRQFTVDSGAISNFVAATNSLRAELGSQASSYQADAQSLLGGFDGSAASVVSQALSDFEEGIARATQALDAISAGLSSVGDTFQEADQANSEIFGFRG